MNKLYVFMSMFSAVSMVINTWLMVVVTQNTGKAVALLERLIQVAGG